MDPAVRVVEATIVDDDLMSALNRLVPQLTATAPVPSESELRQILESPATTLLVARDSTDHDRIVGMLTLAMFRIPTGLRAWIEDVTVDETARGKGVGEALNRAAIALAGSRGARTVELTSRPSREAANRLYQRIGFVRRETNVYRYTIV
jgi:ribosomal protein S18 acetylase RimI-like enzyme